MAQVINVPERSYNPQTTVLNPTVPANTREVKVTFTRVAWPAGKILTVSIKFPNGDDAGGAGFSGGVAVKNGVTITTSSVGIRSDTFLPAGVYTVTAVVEQTFTTAITIDVV